MNSLRAEDPPLPKPTAEILKAEEDRIAAISLATQSTVGVFGVDGQGGGSGVIVSSDGYVVTNYHVSSAFGDRMCCGLSDGRMIDAVIVGIDPTGDVALLKMEGRDPFPTAVIADSDTVEVGQWCFAAGNPFVLATNLQPTVTYGIVSGVKRYQYPAGTILEYTDCIQTDAAINPGNSGGPLYNAKGHLIGINGRCSFEKRGRVNVGVGYAISINQVAKFLGQLKAGRLVDHATLGFTVSTDTTGRVLVSNILESSDAYRRGIRYGDEILSLGGRDIATTNQLKNVLGIFPSHWRIPIRFRNADGVTETLVRLPRLHTEKELWESIEEKSAQEIPKDLKKKGKEGDAPLDEPEQEKKEDDGKDAAKKKEEIDRKESKEGRYEKKEGFVNFYFNRLEQARVRRLAEGLGPWKDAPVLWSLKGHLVAEPTPVAIQVGKRSASMRIGERDYLLDEKVSPGKWIESKDPGALLVALQIVQRWYREGLQASGELIYFGDAPIEGRDVLFDVLNITIGEIDCTIYSDKTNGELRLIELAGDSELDPAEIYMESYRETNGRRWPQRMRLQFGTEPRILVQLDQSAWEEGSVENDPSANRSSSGDSK